jgi:L-ascorbate metabolism protein UlaG (beta-lactamase superfamily)
VKPCLTCLAFMLAALVASTCQNQENAVKHHQVILKYLGTAGWEITNEPTTILVDPYLSRINGPAPPGGGSGHPVAGDTRRAYTWTDIATPDIAAIDAHIQRADFVLVTHTHYDHILDVPHIAVKTRATVIGTESTENVMRAYGVPEEQLSPYEEERTISSKGFRLGSSPAYTARSTTSTTPARQQPRKE